MQVSESNDELWDSETSGETHPSHMENYTELIFSYAFKFEGMLIMLMHCTRLKIMKTMSNGFVSHLCLIPGKVASIRETPIHLGNGTFGTPVNTLQYLFPRTRIQIYTSYKFYIHVSNFVPRCEY